MNIAYFEFDESDIYWVSDKSKSNLRQLMNITLGPKGAASQTGQRAQELFQLATE